MIMLIKWIFVMSMQLIFPNEYGINFTFNVSFYLFLFDVDDESRSNWFDERGDNTIQPISKDPLIILIGPITRVRAKNFNEAFNRLLQDIWANVDYKRATIQEVQYIINLIHIQDRLEDHGLRPKSNSGIIELVLPSIMCYLGKKALSRRFNWKENLTLLWTLRWQQTRLLGQENFLFYFLKRNGSIRGDHFQFGSIFIKKK
jgi:hypothetical protein